jgi:pentatricopeptide repeat protein
MARFILNSMLRSSGKDAKDGIVLHEIPQVKPTIVTFNTLADACKEAGDLAAGLEVLELMNSYNQQPDARTYTILISTVARKPKHTQVKNVNSGGESDPDRAFELLYEMQEKGIKPNGVTFSALIDV